MTEIIITKDYLKSHQNEIFVFGDNTLHQGKGGAAALRNESNVYGFITKRYPNNDDKSFYKPVVYAEIYAIEIDKLKNAIESNQDKIFLISKLGAGLANRYNIFEKVIAKFIKNDLSAYKNVKFLW